MQDVLLHVTDRWLRTIDEGKYTGAVHVFLDLAKVFDTVDHTILCSKLKYYGFQGASYDLLNDYLPDQQQRVLFNGDYPIGALLQMAMVRLKDLF